MRKVIGLVGFKESGKSTVFSVLHEVCGANEVMLAGLLKKTSADVFGLSVEQFDRQDLKEIPFVTPVVLTKEHIQEFLMKFNLCPVQSNEFFNKHVGALLKSPRHIAQYVGSDVLRSIDPDVHIKAAIKQMKNDSVNVVTDIRFKNEFEYFEREFDSDFVSVFIRRASKIPSNLAEAHVSERGILDIGDNCLVLITNDKSKEDLLVKSKRLANAFKKERAA